MGKIGDLFVRLGIKKDGYTKGMAEAKKENEGFSASLGKMKAGALAVWAAVGTAVVKFAQEMINGTNRIGDAWNRTTAQMKAGWDVFIQSVSNWDWGNFASRIREAAAAAKELQNAMDFEFEASNSIKLQKAIMSEELAQLQIEMRDVGKSYEERAAAAKKYLAKVKPIYEQEIELRKTLADSWTKKWLSNSGIGYDEATSKLLQRFLVDYGSDPTLLKAAGTLNEAFKIKNGKFYTTDAYQSRLLSEGQSYKAEVNRAQKLLEIYAKSVGAKYEDILKLILTYEKARGDKDTAPLVKAIEDYYNAQAAMKAENRRVYSSLKTAIANAGGSDEDTKALTGSIKYYEEEIQKLKTQINETTDKNVRVQAQETIDVYTKEIERLKNNVIAEITKKGWQVLSRINRGGSSGSSNDSSKNKKNSQNPLSGRALSKDDILKNNVLTVDDFVPDYMPKSLEQRYNQILAAGERFSEEYRAQNEEFNQYTQMFADALTYGTTNALDELANAIAGVEGSDAGSVVKALLSPLADAAVQAGMLIIAQGTAVEAFKKSLMSLQGAAAIAAGAALVALGVAAKAGLASIGSGAGSGSTGMATSYNGGSYGGSRPTVESQELTVYVKGIISGSDIILASDNTQRKWNR